MDPEPIDAELAEQTIAEIHAHLEAIHAALPFLRSVASRQRRRMIKAGERSEGFIKKSAMVGTLIPEYLPRNLDLETMNRDMALANDLRGLHIRVSRLSELLTDTRALLTSQVYDQALTIYRAAKHAKGPEGMDELVADLGRRFRRPPRTRKPVDE